MFGGKREAGEKTSKIKIFAVVFGFASEVLIEKFESKKKPGD